MTFLLETLVSNLTACCTSEEDGSGLVEPLCPCEGSQRGKEKNR